jgi:hypothetical protein
MPTECNTELFDFEPVAGHKVVAGFDGGAITSDAGALLLGSTDQTLGLVERFAACFVDQRDPDLIEHSVKTLVGQRLFGLALGYEDVNDHDALRHDPLFAVLAGKLKAERRGCAPVAGKSTLNRLEMSKVEATRYHKISYRAEAVETLLVDLFLEAHALPPDEIVLDLDATDVVLHGEQEGRFFHGYYDNYCYLPLYVFCGRHLLAARLRPANQDASAGSVEEMVRIIGRIRSRWPHTRIILRADSGFAREALMAWCEANDVDYLFGLAKNKRLKKAIEVEMTEVSAEGARTGKPARRFKAFNYQTLTSWSRERRVIAKAEWLPAPPADGAGKANPRFLVTSLTGPVHRAQALYEERYCARGEMENRIKECQLDLFGDRASCHTMRANQLRLWFTAFAYVLMQGLRRIALVGTRLADATCGTIRLKLLKIGALVRISVRRIKFSMASAYPYTDVFAQAWARLAAA